MRSRIAIGALLAALVLPAAASASSALPARTVNAALHAADLHDRSTFKNARLTCTWSAKILLYSCVTWTPSTGPGATIVNGVSGIVYSRRTVQACGTIWPSVSQGCRTATSKPACRYALISYTGSSARVAMLNVCRAGWRKRL